MNRRQSKVAERLCEMAASDGIVYYPLGNLDVQKIGGTTWYPVHSVQEGKTWEYFLAADYGSWRGTWTLTGDWYPTEAMQDDAAKAAATYDKNQWI